MLRKTIYTIKKFGTMQLTTIARELEVSEPLAQQLLDELTRLGYLRIISTNESASSCKGCPMRSGCLYRHQTRLWAITEKAQRLIAEDT